MIPLGAKTRPSLATSWLLIVTRLSTKYAVVYTVQPGGASSYALPSSHSDSWSSLKVSGRDWLAGSGIFTSPRDRVRLQPDSETQGLPMYPGAQALGTEIYNRCDAGSGLSLAMIEEVLQRLILALVEINGCWQRINVVKEGTMEPKSLNSYRGQRYSELIQPCEIGKTSVDEGCVHSGIFARSPELPHYHGF